MLTLSSLQFSETQKYSLSFFSALKGKLYVALVSALRRNVICPSAGLTVRVTVSPQLQYQEVYCSLTEESGDQLQPSQLIWKVPCAEVDQNLNAFSYARLRMAKPTATHPLMPSIFSFMLFLLCPIPGQMRTISVCQFSGKSGILTLFGSTILMEGCASVVENLKYLAKSAFGFSNPNTYSQRLSFFFPPVNFSLSYLQSSLTSVRICFKMPFPASRSSKLMAEDSSDSEESSSKLITKSTNFFK